MIIRDVNYPFKSIIEEHNESINDSLATQLAKKYYRTIVSFFTLNKNTKKEFILIGSGFLIKIKNSPKIQIMTASHVITDLTKFNLRIISIDGKHYSLENMNIYHNEEQDYALMDLPTDIKSNSLPYFDLNYREELTPLRSFMITGYPSSRNIFHADKTVKGLSLLNLIFHQFGFNTESEDIYFHYNDKKGKKGTKFTPEPLSENNNIPKLNGMSGGVISQIMIDLSKDSLSLRPIGIFKEHLKIEKLLVGCTFISFSDEIKKYI